MTVTTAVIGVTTAVIAVLQR